MRDDELRHHLNSSNPWWLAAARKVSPTAWTSSHRLLQARDLGYRPDILADISSGPITYRLVVLTGPRRVGKSVALLDVAATLCGRDEIDGWTATLKSARDGTFFGNDTVVVTGSRWADAADIEGHLLAGRAGTVPGRRLRHLLPMSFRDFLAATRSELVRPESRHPSDLQSPTVAATLDEIAFDSDAYDLAWQDYLTAGGFPRAVFEHATNGAVSDTYLRDLAGWLRRDLQDEGPADSLPLLLDTIVSRSTSPLSEKPKRCQ